MYSNGQGFYLTLPSESSKGLFPENNASEYSVRLPHWIHLKGEWEIGLHSIAYTRRNIIHHLDGTILYGYPEHDGTTMLATTGKMQKHYSSVGEYVSNINESLKESHVNKSEIEFTINTDGKVTITLRDGYRSSMFCLYGTGSDVTKYLTTGSDVITLISCRFTPCFPTGSDVITPEVTS